MELQLVENTLVQILYYKAHGLTKEEILEKIESLTDISNRVLSAEEHSKYQNVHSLLLELAFS